MREAGGQALRLLALPLLATLAACQTTESVAPAPPTVVSERPAGEGWRGAARDEGIAKVDGVAGAWEEALAAARGAGFSAQIDEAGALLVPDGALPRAVLPPGSYHCRVIRIGAGAGRRAYTVYPSYFCHVGVEEDLLALTKQTGSERFGGYLYQDGDTRLVFLGAMAGADEEVARAYGANTERDLVGVVERVGPMRYRLVFPRPQSGAIVDVLELVPYTEPLE